MTDASNEITGLDLGAVDYITKPFSPHLLRKRVEFHLLFESQQRKILELNSNIQLIFKEREKLINNQNKIFQSISNLINGNNYEIKDSMNITSYCLNALLIAIKNSEKYNSQVKDWNNDLCISSSKLYDIGKIGINSNILKKSDALTEAEFAAVKSHVAIGVKLIESLGDEDGDLPRIARTFAAHHHEKWDGSGYPDGLAGENIPLAGRLMAVADVYGALTSARPHRKALSHEEAVRFIVAGGGTHFDPAIVDLFERSADQIRVSAGGDATS
jgi:putative two-component system response regulator